MPFTVFLCINLQIALNRTRQKVYTYFTLFGDRSIVPTFSQSITNGSQCKTKYVSLHSYIAA